MTSDVEAPVELQRVSLPPLSEATQASLMAVRRAQEAARERARRETVRARIGAGFVVGAIAVAVIVVGPPVKRRLVAARTASAATMTTTTAPVTPPAEKAPGAMAALPLAAPGPQAPAAQPVPAPAEPARAVAIAEAKAPAPAAAASSTATPEEAACAETLAQHRWQISIDECTRLFESHPNDAALALRIAHAHHAKGHFADAGTWANKAIALDPTLAEGFVLVARAETHAEHLDAALQAYRQYLTLAPRGWHANEARSALRKAGHIATRD